MKQKILSIVAVILLTFVFDVNTFAGNVSLYAPVAYSTTASGCQVDIGGTVSGVSNYMHYNLYIRNTNNLNVNLVSSINNATTSVWYTWNTSGLPAGTYRIYVVAYNTAHIEDCRIERDITLITPYFTPVPSSYNFSDIGGTNSGFMFNSNLTNFTISDNASWLSLSTSTLSNGSSTFSITASQNTSTSPRSAIVTATSQCGYTNAMSITQSGCSYPSQPSTISGNTTVCSGATGLSYSVTNVSGVTYNWSLPAGWTKTAGGTTNSITVTAGTSGGTISVTPSNSCGNGTARTLSVAVPPPPSQPSTISGNSTVCSSATGLSYSVTNVSGVTYNWSLPAGWTKTAGGTTNSITVTAGTSGGTISVTQSNSCGNGTARTLYVSVNTPPTAPTSISGTTTICSGNSTTLTASGGSTGSGCTYQWYSGGCGSGSVLGTGSSLTVSPSSNTTYYVRRVGTSPCNNTTSCASTTVNVSANITQNNPISASISTGTTHTFNLAAAIGGSGSTTYLWQQSTNGSSWTSATGTNNQQNYTTPVLTSNMYYRRQATNTCGGTISSNSALVAVTSIFAQSDPAGTTICSGSTHTFYLAAPVNGYGNITYLWQQSTNGSSGWASATGTNNQQNYTTPTLTSNMYYRRQATDNSSTITSSSALVSVNNPPTAPTSISGTSTINLGQSTTLTAVGGSTGSGCTYQWHSGGCGSGSVLGTGSSITVNPSSNTTYYVRRIGNSPCNTITTACATQNVIVNKPCVPVAPLLSTEWHQCIPYNAQCPAVINGVSGYGNKAPTGCVATAMAQIMKFWNHPTQRIKHIDGYTCDYIDGNITNTIKIDTVTGNPNYDWIIMSNNYPVAYSGTASQDAVAKVMYECGIALKMQYRNKGSGIPSDIENPANNTISVLPEFFGYHTPAVLVRQLNTNWDSVLIEELKAGNPIFYGGSGSGGHAFVCDGYRCDDNKFHFNWGWGGMGDGYFRTSLLDPIANGEQHNYSYDQKIIYKIKPNPSYLDAPPIIADGINTFEITSNSATGGYIIPNGTKIKNLGESNSYTFAANAGYSIDKVFIDGMPDATAKANGYYIFENITANHNIVVTFKNASTGIEEKAINNKLTLFPNPAQGTLYIMSSEVVEQVSIYDISGRMLQQTNNPSTSIGISISSLANGIYIVKVKTIQGETVRKIVKQ